jgi:hypothetical protein
MDTSIGELPDAGERVWFCIQEDAHVGPFSFSQLQAQCSPQQLVWAKGWPEPLPLYLLENAYHQRSPAEVETAEAIPRTAWRLQGKWAWATVLASVAIGLGFFYPRGLVRPAEMPISAFRQARDFFVAKTRAEPLAWVGVRRDYSRLWLLDRSPQSCVFEIQMLSGGSENLSGNPVALQAQSVSKDHWVVIDSWSLAQGQRLWPGHYEIKLSRRHCRAEGIWAWWQSAEKNLSKVFSFPIALNVQDMQARLTLMRTEKIAREKKLRDALLFGWRDVEEKCRTLAAITSQIDTGFRALLNREVQWNTRVKTVVSDYTLRFGGFLTNFVVKNDEDFVRLAALPMEEKNLLLARQPVVNDKARLIGFHSMRLIEWLQLGMPARPALEKQLALLSAELTKLRLELEAEARSAQATYMAMP